MFTGLVAETGQAVSLKRRQKGAVLEVRAPRTSEDAGIGDSIAISGACLTVTAKMGDVMSFDLSDETLKSTTLGSLRPGDRVNLESSLRADSKLGGHFVTGHVDAVGKIRSKRKEGEAFALEIEAPGAVLDFLVEKGSVAVDGISLTVVDVLQGSFTLVIIPHTAEVTTIGAKGPGDPVNLEADILGKYVLRFLERAKSGPGLMKKLAEGGFLGQ
ncbi:MAG: riboflavin synthase [Nitrospirota bacterium]|jgi:riboflavin synthase